MNVKIVNLDGIEYEGEAKALNARTLSGEITILDHHQPIVTVLAKDSRVWVEDNEGKKHEYKTPSGFLHMDGNNSLTVFVD